MANKSQVCRKCKEDQPLISYGKYKNSKKETVLRKTCNRCRSKHQSKRYREVPGVMERAKETSTRCRLKKVYNLTLEQFNQMIEDQGGRCAICKNVFSKTPNIDHCHKTGKIRGLLCWSCNIGLGKFKDSVESLKSAIKYLQE